jgi:hypothetical protein
MSVWEEYPITSRYLTGMCSERGYLAISRIVMAKINFLCQFSEQKLKIELFSSILVGEFIFMTTKWDRLSFR